MFDFETGAERRGTNCGKWDSRLPGQTDDVLPLWVADMDFAAPPAVVEALTARARHGVFGYDFLGEEYYSAVTGWMKRRHNFDVKKEWIVYTSGVVIALHLAVRAATEPGDEIIVFTPVYGPFYGAVQDEGRVLRRVSLLEKDGQYELDFDALEKAVNEKTRAVMFCSPHNPGGRVWRREELTALDEFCRKHDLWVFADEIHHDLILSGEHIVYSSISDYALVKTVLCTAPSKTFNLAGLQASNIIIPDPTMRKKFQKEAAACHMGPSTFAGIAAAAAYDQGDAWLDALLEVIRENARLVKTLLADTPIRAEIPQGTYLMWLDCRAMGKTPEDLEQWFLGEAKLRLNNGAWFGEEAAGFMRMNLACPRTRVEEACRRILAALKG